MERVIAVTSAERAHQMQRMLVGHTMSGEALEQRPQVQFTSAEDFLDAALRIYEITAIRLAPSAHSSSLIEVWATYRPAVFSCEACGKEHHSYPERCFGLNGATHHFVCSPACRCVVQDRLSAEVEAFRATLGDPVEAAMAYLRQRQPLPEKLRFALTQEEDTEVGKRCDAEYTASQRGVVTHSIK